MSSHEIKPAIDDTNSGSHSVAFNSSILTSIYLTLVYFTGILTYVILTVFLAISHVKYRELKEPMLCLQILI